MRVMLSRFRQRCAAQTVRPHLLPAGFAQAIHHVLVKSLTHPRHTLFHIQTEYIRCDLAGPLRRQAIDRSKGWFGRSAIRLAASSTVVS